MAQSRSSCAVIILLLSYSSRREILSLYKHTPTQSQCTSYTYYNNMRLFTTRRLSLRCDSLWPPDRNHAASAAVPRKRFLVKPIIFLSRRNHNRTGGRTFPFGWRPETVYTNHHRSLQALFHDSVLTKVGVIFSHYRKTYRHFYSFFNTFIGRIYMYAVLVETIRCSVKSFSSHESYEYCITFCIVDT